MKRIGLLLLLVVLTNGFVYGKVTFYSSLDSKSEVEEAGGEVFGTAQFIPCHRGNGFFGAEGSDVIAFPVENRFTKLEEGTVELFVKMGVDAKDITDEVFLWFTYKRGTEAIFLQINGILAPGRASFQIKSDGVWYPASSKPINWKKGEKCIIVPAVNDDEAKEKFPDGWDSPKPYIRIVPQPKD